MICVEIEVEVEVEFHLKLKLKLSFHLKLKLKLNSHLELKLKLKFKLKLKLKLKLKIFLNLKLALELPTHLCFDVRTAVEFDPARLLCKVSPDTNAVFFVFFFPGKELLLCEYLFFQFAVGVDTMCRNFNASDGIHFAYVFFHF